MTREEILEVITPFVIARGEEVESDDVQMGVELDSLGIDSIKLGALIGDLQDGLGFKVPEEAMKAEPPKTVGELVDRVMLRVREGLAA